VKFPGSKRDRWIGALCLLAGGGIGAAAFAKATQHPSLVVAPGFIQHEGKTSKRIHSIALHESVCCKVASHVLVFGPGNGSPDLVVSNPTSIDVAIPDVEVGQYGLYTILLLVDQQPVSSLTLSPAALLKLDAITIEYDEVKGVSQITTTPDIGVASVRLERPKQ
jgi:hypothetical protein